MKCYKCSKSLSYKSILNKWYLVCDECKTIFLEDEKLIKIISENKNQTFMNESGYIKFNIGSTRATCPKCKIKMYQIENIKNTVRHIFCKHCTGIWIDIEELMITINNIAIGERFYLAACD
ncbi:hypothetical protein BVX93_01020 [bacterium B13(2017)]|nr:hypothetical protein BVX93_01020 [bacterium B13(2017)]